MVKHFKEEEEVSKYPKIMNKICVCSKKKSKINSRYICVCAAGSGTTDVTIQGIQRELFKWTDNQGPKCASHKPEKCC